MANKNRSKPIDKFTKEGVNYFRYKNDILAGPEEQGMGFYEFNKRTNNVFPRDDYDYYPEFNKDQYLVGYRIVKATRNH